MSKENDKLAKARNRASNSLAMLARAEAREQAKEGARDTKRKILLGAALEVVMRTDENLRERFASFMSSFLKRRADLDVFDLVESDVSYFDRLGEPAESEIDAAVNSLGDEVGALRLGATKSDRGSAISPGASSAIGASPSNGTGPRPPPPPSSSSSSPP